MPADAAGAVGPNNVVSALNGEYWFLSRTGSGQGETGNSFWCTNSNFVVNGCPGTLANPGTSHLLNFDGKISYDAQAGRWVVTSLGGTATQLNSGTHTPFVYLGISKTSDPTGAWDLYWFQGCGNYTNNSIYIGDQPKLGISDKWIVVQDGACGPGPLYNMSVFDKANLYAGPGSLSRGVNWFVLFNPYDESIPAYTVAAPAPSGYEYVIASDISDTGSPALIYSYVFGGVDQPSLYVGQIYVVDSYINNASELLPELETPRCTNCNDSCRCIGATADSRLQSATVQFLKSGDYAALASWNLA